MFSDLGETSHCCAGYSIVGAIFTVSRENENAEKKDLRVSSRFHIRNALRFRQLSVTT